MKEPLEKFEPRMVAGAGAEIFVRTGGDGPPLLLLHGYPQTHVMWHRLAPVLARHFRLVIADLRGYGRSSMPQNDGENRAYSKRAMATDMVAVMAALGFDRFAVAGHDRGARVGYRMALDSPAAVERLAVLDIIPTFDMWNGMDGELALKVYHWLFLAQPPPMPERLIESDSRFYVDWTLASWTRSGDLSSFDEAALAAYRSAFAMPGRVHAACNDYRAGASFDLAADREDRAAGRRIGCPTLALWGTGGIPSEAADSMTIWEGWCDKVEGRAVDSGHFLAEENPTETAAALINFFSGRS
jgi:haloacetate dehalogenase